VTDQHPELPVDPDLAQGAPSRPVHARPRLMLAVVAGGLIGAPARYLLALALPTAPNGWPTATFAVNLAGAFVLGLLLEALARGGPDVGWRRGVRLFAGTGFCGALTTYSTLAVELDLLAHRGHWELAAGYAVASVVSGLVLAAAGVGVAAVAARGRRTRPSGTAAGQDAAAGNGRPGAGR
jgi:fluoride exporter